MKTEKIAINKTAQQPQGAEIEVVVPENRMEEQLIAHLMISFLRELAHDKVISYELPRSVRLDYRGQGTFLASDYASSSGLYEPPRPLAMFGLRHNAGRFDLIHAPIQPRQPQPPQQPASTAAATSQTPSTPPTPSGSSGV